MSSKSRSQSPTTAVDAKDGEHVSRSQSPASDEAGTSKAGSRSQSPTGETAEPEEEEEKTDDVEPEQHDWQAVWSAPHNAFYFFNKKTNETTWTNPLAPPEASATPAQELQPVASASQQQVEPVASSSAIAGSSHDVYAAAAAAGIDPDLAYLDPTLALPQVAGGGPMSFTAKFNSRTGAFTAASARAPEHLGEFERAKRMSEMYFDVGQWEAETQARQEELNERKRKRPNKVEMERFRDQKKRKQMAKTAWLRS